MPKIQIHIYLYLIIFNFIASAQTISIQGKVTSSRYPVINASVIFINNADTTQTYMASKDNLGNYQVGVIIPIYFTQVMI